MHFVLVSYLHRFCVVLLSILEVSYVCRLSALAKHSGARVSSTFFACRVSALTKRSLAHVSSTFWYAVFRLGLNVCSCVEHILVCRVSALPGRSLLCRAHFDACFSSSFTFAHVPRLAGFAKNRHTAQRPSGPAARRPRRVDTSCNYHIVVCL